MLPVFNLTQFEWLPAHFWKCSDAQLIRGYFAFSVLLLSPPPIPTVHSNSNMAGRINDRELITLAVVFLLCTFSGAEAKGHHEVPTYFKRINHDGSLVDAANPQTRVKFLPSIQSDFS